MIDQATVAALMQGDHGDPFAVLGMHQHAGALVVRALLPGAQSVAVIDARSGRRLAGLERVDHSDVFAAAIPRRKNPFAYRLRIDWGSHAQPQLQDLDDPYRFAPILGELDLWLLAEGTHYRPYEKLGAHTAKLTPATPSTCARWAPSFSYGR